MATWSPAPAWQTITNRTISTSVASSRPPARGGTSRLFGGVECSIRPSWWYLSAAIYLACLVFGLAGARLDLANGILLGFWVDAALLSATLAHELGHAFFGARAGLEPKRVVLLWLGGMTAFAGPATNPRQKAISAIGGPTANALLGLFFLVAGYLLGESPGLIFCLAFAAINGTFAVCNLLPVLPQDGGVLLESAFWARVDDPARARRLASGVGSAMGVACTTLGGLLVIANSGGLGRVLLVQGVLTLIALSIGRTRRAPRPVSQPE